VIGIGNHVTTIADHDPGSRTCGGLARRSPANSCASNFFRGPLWSIARLSTRLGHFSAAGPPRVAETALQIRTSRLPAGGQHPNEQEM
jgi:hypothetical protein